ncbi:hypothetical protein, partial [Zavarzinia aquatilis]|uniref:hypothetical protein n=1 Tax=Zavarzinia aquatilis TaxID=2211142 RepID=UPI001A9CB1FE
MRFSIAIAKRRWIGSATAAIRGRYRSAILWRTATVVALLAVSPMAGAQTAPRVYPDNLFGIGLGSSASVASGYHGSVVVAGEDGRAWSTVDSGSSDLLRRVVAVPGHGFAAVGNRGRILAGDATGRAWHEVFAEEGQNLR